MFGFLLCQASVAQSIKQFYVSPNGSDANSGSINQPFATITKAQQYVQQQMVKDHGNYEVILRNGVYALKKPLVFDAKSFGNLNGSIEFKVYAGERATISGGAILPSTWVKSGQPNVWKLDVSSTLGSNPILQSLYKNDKRLERAGSDTLLTKGPISEFSKLYGIYDFNAKNRLVKDSLNVFSGFTYDGNDLDNIADIDNAEVIVFNSWEASWHQIYKIDKKRKIIYFKNPATYPVGFFGPKVRYRIMNSSLYLNRPGEWYFDSQNKQILYYALKGENPNDASFVVPVLDAILTGTGDAEKNIYVSNIKFNGITFSYSKSAWGFSSTANVFRDNNKAHYPWLDFNVGFSGGQTAVDCGSAVTLLACKNWMFHNCKFDHLGNYAIGVSKYSDNNIIENCVIDDIGGGGVMIGFNYIGGKRTQWPESISPSGNIIRNCTIFDCGMIFTASVGIAVMQANHTLISRNTIYNLPYSGMSIGWTFSKEDNYTSYNTIEYNHIYNVMKILADGGGIYTLGQQVGSVYKGNCISNISRSNKALGANNNGFFFDQYSSGMKVDSNVVYGIKNEAIRFNISNAANMQMGYNYFEKMNSNTDLIDMICGKK